MKMSHYMYIVLGVTAIVILTVLTCTSGSTFTWSPTYEADDKEPYGCFVFDSIMRQSVGQGYDVSDRPADSLIADPQYKQHTILIARNNVDIETGKAMEFVKKGGSIIVCANSISHSMGEGWNTGMQRQYSYGLQPEKDLYIHVRYPKDETYPARNYIVSAPIGNFCLGEYDPSYYGYTISENKYYLKWTDKLLMGGRKEWPMVKVANYGKGRIVVCCMPLLFTNYGILENDNYNLIMRIVSLAGRKPMVRTRNANQLQPSKGNNGEGEGQNSSDDHQALMKHILSSTPLRTAFNLMILAFLLFCIFSAKRKQRVVPVMKKKMNGQLNFIKQIGSMHKRKKATDHIVRTKYRVLTENMKQKAGVDIADPDHRTEAIQRISALSGISEADIEQTLNTMDSYFLERGKEMERVKSEVMQEKGDASWPDEMIELKVLQKLSHCSEKKMTRLIDSMDQIDKGIL